MRHEPEFTTEPKAFGDSAIADHIFIYDEEDRGCNGETTALNILDLGSNWGQSEPSFSKTTESTEGALAHFAGNEPISSF